MITVEEVYEVFRDSPGITTDSRKVVKGQIYIALKGDNFDGNDFVENALEQGALMSITDRIGLDHKKGIGYCKNGLLFLQALATYHRRQLGIPIIAITGSNGKTTTKELTAHLLAGKYNVDYTQGNLNNHIGVPLTLLSLTPNTEIGIVEMGANHIGEIAALCKIAQPTHGIVTNMGKAHLEGFGSLEGVIKAKGELYDYLNANGGIIFYNKEVDYLEKRLGGANRVVSYDDTNLHEDDRVYQVHHAIEEDHLQIIIERKEESFSVLTSLTGGYNYRNILAALAIGGYFEVSIQERMKRLVKFSMKMNRSQIQRSGKTTLILDAYNANPTSMNAAIKSFDEMLFEDKYLVLGDMLELGDDEIIEHQKIVDLIQSSSIKKAVLIGDLFGSATLNMKTKHVDSLEDEELILLVQEAKESSNSAVLIKGSRASKLERVEELF